MLRFLYTVAMQLQRCASLCWARLRPGLAPLGCHYVVHALALCTQWAKTTASLWELPISRRTRPSSLLRKLLGFGVGFFRGGGWMAMNPIWVCTYHYNWPNPPGLCFNIFHVQYSSTASQDRTFVLLWMKLKLQMKSGLDRLYDRILHLSVWRASTPLW